MSELLTPMPSSLIHLLTYMTVALLVTKNTHLKAPWVVHIPAQDSDTQKSPGTWLLFASTGLSSILGLLKSTPSTYRLRWKLGG